MKVLSIGILDTFLMNHNTTYYQIVKKTDIPMSTIKHYQNESVRFESWPLYFINVLSRGCNIPETDVFSELLTIRSKQKEQP